MADFYKGFVFEYDVQGRLSIEGRPIEDASGARHKTGGADPGPEALASRAADYIEASDWLAARERVKQAHLDELRKGCEQWNRWRREHPEVQPMFADHDFTTHDPTLVLDDYDLSYANLTQAHLGGMSLRRANFHQAILARADLRGAHLEQANFCRTDFYQTDFTGAFLTEANLQGVQLAGTILTDAHLERCRVYGLAAWDVELTGADQRDLCIRYEELVGGQRHQRQAWVNGIDVASFMYSTLNNRYIGRVIDATTSQWVLLLGRFTVHKEVLTDLAEALRRRNLVPVVFDFEPSPTRDLVETVILLAGLSRFVIVDISDPRSTPLELLAIIPNFSVPVQPILREGSEPFSVFSGLRKFPWVRPPLPYSDSQRLATELASVIAETNTEGLQSGQVIDRRLTIHNPFEG